MKYFKYNIIQLMSLQNYLIKIPHKKFYFNLILVMIKYLNKLVIQFYLLQEII